jgi:hypothetical protein
MANGSFQLDPSLQPIPVTGQPSGVAATLNAQPVTLQDLRSYLPQSQQQQQPSAQQATSFDAQTQAKLDSLQPDFADRTKQWIQGMRAAGYDPVLTYGYRSPQEQQKLYEKHLAGGPQAVAPPMSYHTYGRAFDWMNRGPDGKLQEENDKAYQFGQKLATNYKLTGIGAGDNDHIQDANYKSWKDLPRSEYGNVAPKQQPAPQVTLSAGQTQSAQAQTDRTQMPVYQIANTGGPQWQDLSQYLK